MALLIKFLPLVTLLVPGFSYGTLPIVDDQKLSLPNESTDKDDQSELRDSMLREFVQNQVQLKNDIENLIKESCEDPYGFDNLKDIKASLDEITELDISLDAITPLLKKHFDSMKDSKVLVKKVLSRNGAYAGQAYGPLSTIRYEVENYKSVKEPSDPNFRATLEIIGSLINIWNEKFLPQLNRITEDVTNQEYLYMPYDWNEEISSLVESINNYLNTLQNISSLDINAWEKNDFGSNSKYERWCLAVNDVIPVLKDLLSYLEECSKKIKEEVQSQTKNYFSAFIKKVKNSTRFQKYKNKYITSAQRAPTAEEAPCFKNIMNTIGVNQVRILDLSSFISGLNLTENMKSHFMQLLHCPEEVYLKEVRAFVDVYVEIDPDVDVFVKRWFETSASNLFRRGLIIATMALCRSPLSPMDFVNNKYFKEIVNERGNIKLYRKLTIKSGEHNCCTDSEGKWEITKSKHELPTVLNFRIRNKESNEDQNVKSNWRESQNVQGTIMTDRYVFDHELGHLLLGYFHRFEHKDVYHSRTKAQGELVVHLQNIRYKKEQGEYFNDIYYAKDFWDVLDDQEQIAGVYLGTKNGDVDARFTNPADYEQGTPEVLVINSLSSDWYSSAIRGAEIRFGHSGAKSGQSGVKSSEIESITPSETAINLYDYYERKATVSKLNNILTKDGSVEVAYLRDKRFPVVQGKKDGDVSVTNDAEILIKEAKESKDTDVSVNKNAEDNTVNGKKKRNIFANGLKKIKELVKKVKGRRNEVRTLVNNDEMDQKNIVKNTVAENKGNTNKQEEDNGLSGILATKDASLSYVEVTLNSEDEIFKLCFDRKNHYIVINNK